MRGVEAQSIWVGYCLELSPGAVSAQTISRSKELCLDTIFRINNQSRTESCVFCCPDARGLHVTTVRSSLGQVAVRLCFVHDSGQHAPNPSRGRTDDDVMSPAIFLLSI